VIIYEDFSQSYANTYSNKFDFPRRIWKNLSVRR